jgi:tRNA-specific 2-thiouridylase
MIKSKGKKIFVGLSGGVDSAVSVALLKKAGFNVSGVFIKVWQPNIKITGGCTWREDRLDAMRVCAKLDIPFYTLDLEKEYKKNVVDYMLAEYKAGRTPNPDVMCNKHIKFSGFFNWAMKKGADYVATGHYARVKTQKSKNKIEYQMLAGVDKNKDQSYFLWTLTQKQLSQTLFPVGDLEKPEVRKLAKKFDLDNATKKDSQGVCFIGKVEMTDFLKKYIKPKKGKILNEKGEIIGNHDGIYYYTLGQRHGLEIIKKTADEKRYFIVKKDFKNNTLTVSNNPIREEEISNQEIKLKNVNWISSRAPDLKKEYSARIRYRQPLEKCHLDYQGKTLVVKFKNPQKAPTPGQSVVIYDTRPLNGSDKVCLGGGIIV